MQAWVDGKEIEWCCWNNKWESTAHQSTNISWNWLKMNYRIKPEPTYRPYRPYDDAKELYADIQKHGGWVIDGGTYRYIEKFTQQGSRISISLSGLQEWGINELPRIEKIVWADDNTPFGKLEE